MVEGVHILRPLARLNDDCKVVNKARLHRYDKTADLSCNNQIPGPEILKTIWISLARSAHTSVFPLALRVA